MDRPSASRQNLQLSRTSESPTDITSPRRDTDSDTNADPPPQHPLRLRLPNVFAEIGPPQSPAFRSRYGAAATLPTQLHRMLDITWA